MEKEKVDGPPLEFAGWQSEGPSVMMRNEEKQPRCATKSSTGVASCPESQDSLSTFAQEKQRMLALDGANVVRIARANVRRRLATLELPFEDFLDETPETCLKVAIVKVLQWLPNIGRNRAYSIISILSVDDPRITADTRLGELQNSDKCRLFDLVYLHLEEYARVYGQAVA